VNETLTDLRAQIFASNIITSAAGLGVGSSDLGVLAAPGAQIGFPGFPLNRASTARSRASRDSIA